ncbi:MAG: 3-dehydroquinate synthase [Pontixanthobacter sp.]
MAVIRVELAGRAYDVIVGHGILSEIAELAASFLSKPTVPIVADVNARSAHGANLAASLKEAGLTAHWFDVPSGEASKCWGELERLTDWLLSEGVERGDNVIALGGGVVGDLAGFACSMVKRGCGFVQIPTTLLAQVDSSVGGKTAINTAAGKNLIGAFHQPSLVLADIATLATLPKRQLQAGYAEVVKYGLLGDSEFFAWCEANGPTLLTGDNGLLETAIAHSVAAKARIVAMDERETDDVRALLNLGHTFGHALEAECGFSDELLHGEAVALGTVLAARYSERLGHLSIADTQRVAEAFEKAGMRSEISTLGMKANGAALVRHMRNDKKMASGTLPFILLRRIGEAFVDRSVALDDVTAFLDEQLQAH